MFDRRHVKVNRCVAHVDMWALQKNIFVRGVSCALFVKLLLL